MSPVTSFNLTELIGQVIKLLAIALVLVFIYVDPLKGIRHLLHKAVDAIKFVLEVLTDSFSPKLMDTAQFDSHRDVACHLVAPAQTDKCLTDVEQDVCTLQCNKLLRAKCVEQNVMLKLAQQQLQLQTTMLDAAASLTVQQTTMLNATRDHITMLLDLLGKAKEQQASELSLAKQQIADLQDTVMDLKLLIDEQFMQHREKFQLVQDSALQMQIRTERLEKGREVREDLSRTVPPQVESYVPVHASKSLHPVSPPCPHSQCTPTVVGLTALDPSATGHDRGNASGPIQAVGNLPPRPDLTKIAKCIPYFDPQPGKAKDTHIYLENLEHHFADYRICDTETKVRVIYLTANREVIGFVRRQPRDVQTNWPSLCNAIIDEFADRKALGGLTSAMSVRQHGGEDINRFYNRLRIAFFGSRNFPSMEESPLFKDLFLSNLHPSIKSHMPLGTNFKELSATKLRNLARAAFDRESIEPQSAFYNAQIEAFLPRGQDNYSYPTSQEDTGVTCKNPNLAAEFPADPKLSRRQRKARLHAATQNSSSARDNENWRSTMRVNSA